MIIEGIQLDPTKLPKHIAIIMDGNRRWAEQNSVSVLEGHHAGLKRVIDIKSNCYPVHTVISTLRSPKTMK